MAVKTVYVSEDDVTLWEQMGVVASRERRSVSWVLHEAIRCYLRELALEDDRRARELAAAMKNADAATS
jgi:sulfur transfer complex TusBCD TusB component (DsrH family)